MVGFNRRFAPLLTGMKEGFGPAAARSVTRYLVNAGPLATGSWYLNEEAEGSRFTGEGGHFIDTLSWWADSLAEEVYATGGPEKGDVTAAIRFASGASGPRSSTSSRRPEPAARCRSASTHCLPPPGLRSQSARAC